MRHLKFTFIFILTFLPAIALAQTEREVPKSMTQVQLSFAPAVKRVSPAVVNILTKRRVQEIALSPLMADPFFRQFFEGGMLPGQRRERTQNSLGSGVIVDKTGLIVTANHVIKDADEITVVLSDRREYPAEIAVRDERTDLAVIRIRPEDKNLPILELGNSDALEVGDMVLAIGNPFGVGQTVTSGIVSALARTKVGISDYSFFIQTDAAINPGNSGGALVTLDGKLVGINTAIFSKTGASAGIGFAVPASMVKTVITSSQSGKKIVRPWMGITGQEVTADIAQNLGLSKPGGVLISKVDPRSPKGSLIDQSGRTVQNNIGLLQNDVVLAINGQEVFDAEALKFRIATMELGQNASMNIYRNGRYFTLNLRLIPPPDDLAADKLTIQGRNPLAGAVIAEISPALEEELGVNVEGEGVIVVAVKAGSRADRMRLLPGDIILRVNNETITTVRDAADALRGNPPRWDITIRRGNQEIRSITQG